MRHFKKGRKAMTEKNTLEEYNKKDDKQTTN
jgi:hypothetical protein